MLVRKRIVKVMCSFLIVFIFLAAGTGYQQIIQGQQLAGQAVAMRSKKVELSEHPRGEILDRNLIPLTDYQQTQAVFFLLTGETRQTYNIERAASCLANALGNKSRLEILEKIKTAEKKGSLFARIAIDLTPEQIARINLAAAKGLVVAPINKRYGTEGPCAHIIGYVSNIGSCNGLAGLEKIYDDILQKNRPERELVTVLDARGMAIQGLMFKIRQEQTSEQGQVVLTIDRRFQQIVEDALDQAGITGAAVVLDIDTREILAMASRPSFDQNEIGAALQNKANSPFVNRALNSYHPGSLFKILLAAAALEEGKVSMEETFTCDGRIDINSEVSINCWQEQGHGAITFSEAFASSCNPAFIELGQRLGRSNLLKYTRQLRVTDNAVIGFPACQEGSFVKINPGRAALANASIGQQGVMLTPLQLASLTATIADNGWYKSPSLVRYTVSNSGDRLIYSSGPGERVLKAETAILVRKLMEECVNKGTGKNAALNEVITAGKTATSQTGIEKEGLEVLNAWFGGYLPADKPRWAISILVEEGKSGAGEAAPIFKSIAQELLPLYSSTSSSES